MVDNHSLVVALVGQSHLFDKALLLVYRVVQFRVGIGQFLAVHHQLEALGESRLRTVHFCQRTHLHRIVGDERWLYECAFRSLAEYLVNQLALAHNICILYAKRLGYLADLLFALSFEVVA